jgi:hypothetical protein
MYIHEPKLDIKNTMWWMLGLVVGGLHDSCGPEIASVCDVESTIVRYTDSYETGSNCLLCNTPACNTTNPSTGMLAWFIHLAWPFAICISRG